MKTLTIYLKYTTDLQYSLDNSTWSPMQDNSEFGVNAGNVVVLYAVDDSIKSIDGITINESKRHAADDSFWEVDPAVVQGSKKKVFVGVVNPDLDSTTKWNGFSISYKTASGPKVKDPDFRQPPTT